MAERIIVLPTDRSIPPVMMISVIGSATIPISTMFLSITLIIYGAVRNDGLLTAIPLNMTSQIKNRALLNENFSTFFIRLSHLLFLSAFLPESPVFSSDI